MHCDSMLSQGLLFRGSGLELQQSNSKQGRDRSNLPTWAVLLENCCAARQADIGTVTAAVSDSTGTSPPFQCRDRQGLPFVLCIGGKNMLLLNCNISQLINR